jgi:hypothetical protein
MNDEDFHQIVLDYINMIAPQRHRDQMAQGSEILAKCTEINTALDAMKANFEKSLAGASETIPAGHAAVLDTFVGPLEDIHKKIIALEGEMIARVQVIPVPGVGPSPGVAPGPQ